MWPFGLALKKYYLEMAGHKHTHDSVVMTDLEMVFILRPRGGWKINVMTNYIKNYTGINKKKIIQLHWIGTDLIFREFRINFGKMT